MATISFATFTPARRSLGEGGARRAAGLRALPANGDGPMATVNFVNFTFGRAGDVRVLPANGRGPMATVNFVNFTLGHAADGMRHWNETPEQLYPLPMCPLCVFTPEHALLL